MSVAGVSEEIGLRTGWLEKFRPSADFLAREAALQKPRLFLWFPVFLSFGIAAYFSLRAEPPVILTVAAVLIAMALFYLAGARHRTPCFLALLVVTGFAAAQARTHLIYTPILKKEISPVMVGGRIELIEEMEGGKGSRVVLRDVQIEGLGPEDTPRKIRLSVRKDDGLLAGQRIRLLAGIGPPSPPLNPGGFDFQRYMFFQGIGGLGFAFNAPEIIGDADASGDFIEDVRVAIDRRIAASMPHPEAAVAMALITGRRAAISDEANDAISAAGLAHILSISGLHIGLVSGIIFFVARLLMVCIPGFALRFPAKKYAAVFAFAGAAFYTMLAGATVPTQRSLIMIGIALFAVIVDRSPLSIRLVAFAALMVLLVSPESLTTASFQMSFGAVAALVVVFDWLRPWLSAQYRAAGMVKKAALYFIGVCLTTIIATLATAPLTAFHFQQLAIYGVVGNGLAVPLSSFVIMPAAVLGVLAMPLGLEHWPLTAMEWGVKGMIDISYWVAGLPHALVKIPAPPGIVLPLFVLGIVCLFLWRGRLRCAALLPVMAAMVIAWNHQPADILVSPRFDIVAVKDSSGFYVSSLRKEKFIREKWESLYGLVKDESQGWPKEGGIGPLRCDEAACRAELHGQHVSFLRNPSALAEECVWADVILSFDPVKTERCNVPVIDKFDAIDNGAYGVWLGPQIKITSAQEARGSRPWSGAALISNDKSASGSPAGPGF